MESITRFVQGVQTFDGKGLLHPVSLGENFEYTVPSDRRSQLIYLRVGNSCDAMVYLVLERESKPMRYFPVGARGAIHVSLALTEDIFPDTKLELKIAAPLGVTGVAVVDMGLIEI
jgi:hypothetical protein